jgi:hypothetical protein
MAEQYYSVAIELAGPPLNGRENLLEALVDACQASEVLEAPAVAWGGSILPGPGVQASVRAADANQAFSRAFEGFGKALADVGIEAVQPFRAELVQEVLVDRLLKHDSRIPQLVGLAELAKLLGVSKQRVSELRARDDFPKPIADLAAGPVWALPMLQRFLKEWPRRGGRPKMRRWSIIARFSLTNEAPVGRERKRHLAILDSLAKEREGKLMSGHGPDLVLTLPYEVPESLTEDAVRTRGYEILHAVTDKAGLRIMFELHHEGVPEFREGDISTATR